MQSTAELATVLGRCWRWRGKERRGKACLELKLPGWAGLTMSASGLCPRAANQALLFDAGIILLDR